MSRSFLDEAGDLSISSPPSSCPIWPDAWSTVALTAMPPPTAGERERAWRTGERTGRTGERRGGAAVSPAMETELGPIAMEAGCGDDIAMEPRGGVAAVVDYPILPESFFSLPMGVQ